MNIGTRFFIILCLGTCASVHSQQIDYKGFPQWKFGKKDSTEFYLYTPSVVKQGGKYPLVLFLHGCCGQDYHATLRNAVDPPVRVWHNFGANTQREPTYILSPKTKIGWTQHIENLKFVIDSMIENHNADPQRIYISGFSMGSAGTWEFVEKYPDYFAAAVPMGMHFRGNDTTKFKNIPIWTIRGETDWWGKGLGTAVAAIRRLNGGPADSVDWETGVNPRMTTFKGMGHGVMWPAVSQLPVLDWVYSKKNDGNKYPVAFFKSPGYKQKFKEGATVPLEIIATDPDGTIERVEIAVNGKKLKTIKKSPFVADVKAVKGDMQISATAYDAKGKAVAANTIVRVDVPVKFATGTLPVARAGKMFQSKLQASGNGAIEFSIRGDSKVPEGILLSADGTLRGIPIAAGDYLINVVARDEDGDSVSNNLKFSVGRKDPKDVIVTNAVNYNGTRFPIASIALDEMPFNGGNDEVTFSGGIDKYKGLTLIQTDAGDTVNAEPHYLKFDVDEDVTVFVAYEKLDNQFTSSTPDWLRDYKKVDGEQIVAQYYYYDVYSREFPKGTVMIPDAFEKKNGVNTNYFVMVKRR